MNKAGEITLDEVLEEAGLIKKWEARGERTAWEKFVALMKQGCTVEKLERMAPGGFTPPHSGQQTAMLPADGVQSAYRLVIL
jgi:hypothetical protein